MPRRRFAVTAAIAVICLLAGGAVANAQNNEATFNVWTWNVAGWKMHGGATDTGLIEAASASIQNRETDFAALNELCHSQYSAIIGALRDAGWPADADNFARFNETNPEGCGGEAAGNAIFSRHALGSADEMTLPDDGAAEQRSLICAPLADTRSARLCTTHITTSNEVIDGEKINEQQLNAVNDRLEEYHSGGETVIIAADFNAQPNYGRMNNWYSSQLDHPNNPDNTGHYRELDDNDADNCPGYGEYTQDEADPSGPCGPGKKIDMIFVREDRIAGDYSGDALEVSGDCGGPCSDHRIVIGTVTVTV